MVKVVALFNLGYVEEAANLGFSIYDTRDRHPKSVFISHYPHRIQCFRDSHRHTRYALFFHSLALIACIREEFIREDEHQRYLEQIAANQMYLRRYVTSDSATSIIYTYWIPRWLSASPVNTSTWVTLVVSRLENGRGCALIFCRRMPSSRPSKIVEMHSSCMMPLLCELSRVVEGLLDEKLSP